MRISVLLKNKMVCVIYYEIFKDELILYERQTLLKPNRLNYIGFRTSPISESDLENLTNECIRFKLEATIRDILLKKPRIHNILPKEPVNFVAKRLEVRDSPEIRGTYSKEDIIRAQHLK